MSLPKNQSKSPTRTRIRLLATTDIHGHLLPYDYIRDKPTKGGGLAGLASLISSERKQAKAAKVPVILLDNGDTFQGTPLASHLAQKDVDAKHPIVATLNYLEYDALGLGNHDLDYGLPYLNAVAAKLHAPILNSNLRNTGIDPLLQSLLLPVDLGDQAPAPLTLGILSVLPIQSAAWQGHLMGPATSIVTPEIAISGAAKALRRDGADLIVVLGHMGVGILNDTSGDKQAAHALVRTGQIDALILGHTHRRFPSSDYSTREGVDIKSSTLGDVPTLMAGHAGSDLGVMDLTLTYEKVRGWRVVDHSCLLRPNGPDVTPDPAVVAFAQPTHKEVRRQLLKSVATATTEIHSYFSLVRPAPTQKLTAMAQQRQVTAALKGSPYEDIPVLASAAAHGAGGRDGPENYIYIPKGPVQHRHIAGLNPFTNQTVGIQVTGACLRNWLEHAALLFTKLDLLNPSQMLINADIPAFQFDTIYGLNYCIDPTAPPFSRISQIEHSGAPVRPDQAFILATSHFRAAGGGGYVPIPEAQIVCRIASPLRNSLIDVLQNPDTTLWNATPPWRFAPLDGVQAVILTHPDALKCIKDIAHLHPRLTGSTPEGFIQLSITL